MKNNLDRNKTDTVKIVIHFFVMSGGKRAGKSTFFMLSLIPARSSCQPQKINIIPYNAFQGGG